MKNDQTIASKKPLGERLGDLFDFSVLSITDNGKRITFLAIFIPKLLETLFARLIGTVNTLMISGYAQNAVGATTSATQIINIFTILMNVTVTGCTITASIELGRGNRARAGRIVSTALLMSMLTSGAASLFLFLAAEPLLVMLSLEGDALVYGVEYLKIRGGLLFLSTLGSFLNTMLICNGKATHTMISGMISNTVNVIFVYLLLYAKLIPGLSGTAAVATATEIAALASIIYSAVTFMHSGCPFVLCFDKSVLGRLYKIGIPGSIASLAYNLAITVTVGFIGVMGIVSLNAYSYTNSIVTYACMISAVVSAAVPVFVGRYAGRGDIDSIKKFCRIMLLFAVAANAVISLFILIFHRNLLSVFTDNEEIFAMALAIFAIDFVIECFRAVVNVTEAALNACGDVITTLITGLSSAWGCIVLFSYVLGVSLGIGLIGCWIAFAISEIAKAVTYIIHFSRGKWIKAIR